MNTPTTPAPAFLTPATPAPSSSPPASWLDLCDKSLLISASRPSVTALVKNTVIHQIPNLSAEEINISGTLKIELDAFRERILSLGLAQIFVDRRSQEKRYVFAGAAGAVDFSWTESSIEIESVFTDSVTAQDFNNILDEVMTGASPRGRVYVLGQTSEGLDLIALGTVLEPLQRENYSDTILAAFDRSTASLKSSAPDGRLFVLEGDPGTGKSFFIRGLIHATPGLTWVIVPADMVSQLGHPQLIPTLINHRRQEQAIVMILEDADECLVRREGDNISSIASLLQFGDGMFGEMLDIRIIASTNAKKLDLEPALLRDGRMAEHIMFAGLGEEQAFKIMHRLFGSAGVDGGVASGMTGGVTGGVPTKSLGFSERSNLTYSLASIYKNARKLGWEPPAVVPPSRRPPRHRDYE